MSYRKKNHFYNLAIINVDISVFQKTFAPTEKKALF